MAILKKIEKFIPAVRILFPMVLSRLKNQAAGLQSAGGRGTLS